MGTAIRCSARARPERHLLRGDDQRARVVLQERLGAIAVVDVKIDDRHAFKSMVIQRVFRGNRDIAKDAKAHGQLLFGVVAGRAHGDKGVPRLTAQHHVHGLDRATRRAPDGVVRRWAEEGFGIGVPVEAREPVVGHLGAHKVDVVLRMAPRDIGIFGQGRIDAQQVEIFQCALDIGQASNLFRHAGGCDMEETIGVGKKRGFHVCVSTSDPTTSRCRKWAFQCLTFECP